MFNTNTVPLPFFCKPYHDESLVSFILRLTELNHLRNPRQLLEYICGFSTKPPTPKHITRIAELTCNSPNDIENLFGFEWQLNNFGTVWRYNNEYITKPYFISSRYLSYCPLCLKEKQYLRAWWEFTFYTTCAIHNVNLEDRCPTCHRLMTWKRPGVNLCICNSTISEAIPQISDKILNFFSTIIVKHINPNDDLSVPSLLPNNIVRKLLNLDLDALFKTIWLFGYILRYQHKNSKKSNKPKKVIKSQEILLSAFQILENWPESFYISLRYFSEHLSAGQSHVLLTKLLGPIHRYITEDMDSTEFDFIRNAYERHIRILWETLQRPVPISISSRQLELPLEERSNGK